MVSLASRHGQAQCCDRLHATPPPLAATPLRSPTSWTPRAGWWWTLASSRTSKSNVSVRA